jgi:hypothetical protein
LASRRIAGLTVYPFPVRIGLASAIQGARGTVA